MNVAGNADEARFDLGRGDPDLPPPEAVREATRRILDGRFGYNAGLAELRVAVAADLARRYRVPVRAQQVVPTHGATGALYASLAATVPPGAEVVYLSPAWSLVARMIDMIGAVGVPVPVGAGDPVAELRRAVTPRTAALLINSPHNPTGTVLGASVLEACVREVTAANPQAWVISDETYERLVFPPAVHTCVLQVAPEHPRKIVIGSFSKTFSMSGWRIGYAVVPDAGTSGVTVDLDTANHTLTGSVSMLAQHAALAALSGLEAETAARVGEYQRRRDLALERLAAYPDLAAARPDGTFYLFVDVRERGLTSAQAAEVLRGRGVAVFPGCGFGADGEGHLRIALVRPEHDLIEAIDRIGAPW